MTFSFQSFQVRAPGRVFLFGEHSDYFQLEVISAALNLAIFLEVRPRKDDNIQVRFQDLGTVDRFSINELPVPYRFSRDYLRSAFNVIVKHGFKINTGVTITVHGTIPIAGGLSSSSALAVAAVRVFAQLADMSLTREEIARYAFQAEVEEFNEAGGMMDHLASSFGGILHVDFTQPLKKTPIPLALKGFVIGDSLEKKTDTVGDIKKIKQTVQTGFSQLKQYSPDFDPRRTTCEEIAPFLNKLSKATGRMTAAIIKNRELTRKAFTLFQERKMTPEVLGSLLEEHHCLLRDGLHRSTKKLEKMIAAVKAAGALGAKMNGSGGGGTMIAFAPGREQAVAKAIEAAGGKAYYVTISGGAELTFLTE